MGVFNELRFVMPGGAPDGVFKLVKFKQDVLLQAAKGKISPQHFKIVEGGACAAYALKWIEQKFYPPTAAEGKFSRSSGVKSANDQGSINLAAKLAKDFVSHYVAIGEESDFVQATHNLAYEYRLQFDEEDWQLGKLMEIVNHYKDNLPPGQAVYITLSIEGFDNTHAVALFKGIDRFLYFFDPNVGEYKIRGDQITHFFETYERILARNEPSWILKEECLGRRVGLQ